MVKVVNGERLLPNARNVAVGLAMLLLGSASALEVVAAEADPVQFFLAGVASQQEAITAHSRADAVGTLEKAAEQFRRATQLKPDYFEAQALWADALFQLLLIRAELKQPFENELQAARERFAIAARCPGVVYSLYVDWAQLLTFEADHVATAGPRLREVLGELQRVYEAGMARANFSHERAPMERQLAKCLLLQARAAEDAATKQEFYAKAIARFELASKAQSRLASIYAGWGWALVDLAKLKNNDAAMLREAIARCQKAVELDPSDDESRYNIACCHALLKEYSQAIELLRVCLENDSRRTLLESIQADPDFEPLRKRPDFAELVKPKPHRADMEKVFGEGVRFQRLAEITAAQADGDELYRKAIERYEQVIRDDPRHYRAHRASAQCLKAIALHTTEIPKRRALIESAREHLRAAAHDPDVEWSLYSLWGRMLVTEQITIATSDKDRLAYLTEAREAYESGLELSRFSGERATLEAGLAECLAYTANATTESGERRRLCAEAIAKFESAAKLRPEAIDPGVSAMWGLSLLHLGRATNDRAALRQAVERLQFSAEKDPTRPDTFYNLACAYALLSDPGAAVRHLRTCFERDREHAYIGMAAQDADFKSLRSSHAFNELFTPKSSR